MSLIESNKKRTRDEFAASCVDDHDDGAVAPSIERHSKAPAHGAGDRPDERYCGRIVVIDLSPIRDNLDVVSVIVSFMVIKDVQSCRLACRAFRDRINATCSLFLLNKTIYVRYNSSRFKYERF